MSDTARYREQTEGLSPPELLSWAVSTFGAERVGFASSLGAEDQAIMSMVARHAPGIRAFTLDTGRLHQETYDLLDRTRARYGVEISVYFPDHNQVEKMVRTHGANLFYESVENRKLCCHVRKVEPLGRALDGLDAWIVGLRREQSVTRTDLETVDWDENNGLVRIAPLAAWTSRELWQYIRENDVPYHPLHDHGYPSIGCAPCTRAVKAGEDERAGRWWWEHPEHKECGLHVSGVSEPETANGTADAPFGIGRVAGP